jgi:hypothetical protein
MTKTHLVATGTFAAPSKGLWRPPMLRRNLVVVVVLCITVAALTGHDFISLSEMRRTLPDSFGATHTSFLKTFASGFGPGANETGFAVIRLSEDGAARIAQGGIPWLNAQSGGRLQPDWSATPVPRDEFWMGRPDSAMGAWPDPTVRAVLDRYGHGFPVPAEHQEALDAALTATGSFYAFGSGGLVVVLVPDTRRAYVVFAG